jgi:hypothetical protein
VDLYSGGAGFESRPGHPLLDMFVSLSSQMPG